MSNSYTPPDRSTYDPGWNDPPPMPTAAGSNPATNVANKPRTSLNKRVAFPMQSSPASQTTVKTTTEGLPLPYSTAKYQPPPPAPLSSASPPPPPTALPPPPPSSDNTAVPPATQSVTADDFDSMSARERCHSIFGQIADKMATSTHSTEPGKLNEIRKRLESLHHMWTDNKLDEAVQKKLYALAKALENEDPAAAMEQHRNLVTHHINVSTHWATALRQLILTLCPDVESTTQDMPAQLPGTETVQFVDISTKPVVMDSNAPPFLQPIQPLPTPISDATITSQTSSNENNDANPTNANVNTNTAESNESTSKSKFGRFGRILHI